MKVCLTVWIKFQNVNFYLRKSEEMNVFKRKGKKRKRK